MHWTKWIVVILFALNAGWMIFDGARALIVGDYVTPQTGESAGQLGPWANLVKTAGIEPRSTLMKGIFVGYGLLALLMALAFAFGQSWSWWGMLIMAMLGLWYLPFGTLVGVVVIILLLLPPLRMLTP